MSTFFLEWVQVRQKMKAGIVTLALTAASWSITGVADSTEARCDIYPRGSDHASKMIPCTFSQRQGYVTIARDDGVTHDLLPAGDQPGNFRDQDERTVYRNSGLGDQGLIFRFPDESVYVYWNTAALQPQTDEDNWSAPFTTADYDATTRLRCRGVDEAEFGSCPAGILRMENAQASIVIQNQRGEQFTINFMSDYTTATNRAVEAVLEGDTYIVTIDDREIYEVPMAAIEGG
jgi:hypothetical protein